MNLAIEDKVLYRWYALVKRKASDEKEWVPTCWKSDTEKGALEIESKPLYFYEFNNKETKLVCERTTFAPLN